MAFIYENTCRNFLKVVGGQKLKKKVGRWKKDKKLTKSSENFRDGVARKVNMFIINQMSRNFQTLSSMAIKYVYIQNKKSNKSPMGMKIHLNTQKNRASFSKI